LLKETSRQARVEIEVPNRNRLLKPGMFIRVQIELNRHDDATVVPVAALTKRNSQQGVFLADTQNMKAHFIPVTLGIVNTELAEVVKPSLSGSVVTVGDHLLEDGSSITLPLEEPERSSPRLVNPGAPTGGGRTPSGEKQ
jgi:multidrug efflux pump subunit AcrA (membrane-fusion protein)